MAYEPNTKLRNLQKGGQVVQPNIELPPDNNGWPDPLTDPSSPYKVSVTNGKNGEQNNMDKTETSQATTGGWHLAEGRSGGAETQPAGLDGQRAKSESTSQPIWSDPGGRMSPPMPSQQWTNEDAMNRKDKNPLQTSQQIRNEHHAPESA